MTVCLLVSTITVLRFTVSALESVSLSPSFCMELSSFVDPFRPQLPNNLFHNTSLLLLQLVCSSLTWTVNFFPLRQRNKSISYVVPKFGLSLIQIPRALLQFFHVFGLWISLKRLILRFYIWLLLFRFI